MAAFEQCVWLIRKFVWTLHRRGMAGTLKIILGRLKAGYEPAAARYEPHPFDLRHGVETSGFVGGPNLRTGHRHDAYATAYWAVSPSRARDLLSKWQESPRVLPLEEYSFIDIGCGKGRMLLIASEFPFRQVIGVEFNQNLAQIALKNADKWTLHGLARCPIQVISKDATEITLPDNPCLVFLYNPFGGPVLESLLRRFDEHFGQRWGELDILYLVPEFAAVFQQRGIYRLLWQANFIQSDVNEPEDVVALGGQPCNAYRR